MASWQTMRRSKTRDQRSAVRGQIAFALYEVLIGLAIFALGVLALGRAAQPSNRSKSNFMFIVPVNRRRGFTLLEIIMAVAILATMALAIYRFVQSNMVAIRLSSEAIAADSRYDGLREVLAAQWQSLPSGRGALLGDAFKLNDRERDEVRWICSAGPGLMTRYAAGDFVVALRLQS